MWVVAWIAGVAVLSGSPENGAQRVELANGYYLLVRPPDVPPVTPLPLIVSLHGTDDSAADILRFWRALSADLPYVFVAPQGSRAGWRDADLPLLREMLEHVRGNVVFDPRRVLLTGHSAGGAMAFRLLYVESFPAAAVALTANYLPPTITPEQVRGRADVPVFYAVGTQDLNQERMRQGVALLRAAGVPITMRRPRIGHVLDRGVGQEALQWFERLCRDHLQTRIDRAGDYKGPEGDVGLLAAELEYVLRYPQTHFSDQVPQVRPALARLEEPGRRQLARAQELTDLHQYVEAHRLYLRVERDYQPAGLAGVARECRLKLERDPRAAADLAGAFRDEQAAPRPERG